MEVKIINITSHWGHSSRLIRIHKSFEKTRLNKVELKKFKVLHSLLIVYEN